jgi:hypothetical protein
VRLNKGPKEYGSCLNQWTLETLEIFFLVRPAIVFQGRCLLLQSLHERHCIHRLYVNERAVGECIPSQAAKDS